MGMNALIDCWLSPALIGGTSHAHSRPAYPSQLLGNVGFGVGAGTPRSCILLLCGLCFDQHIRCTQLLPGNSWVALWCCQLHWPGVLQSCGLHGAHD